MKLPCNDAATRIAHRCCAIGVNDYIAEPAILTGRSDTLGNPTTYTPTVEKLRFY